MTHETETGFGSGLRRELERKLAPEPQEEREEVVEHEIAPATPESLVLLQEPEPEPEPLTTVPEIAALRAELEDALAREQELRNALQHHVEAYERELDADRDVALREAEADQRDARLDEREAALEEQRERLERELSALSSERSELVAEEARLATFAEHVDARGAELESADRDRAQAAAHVAQQVAALAERERELKRERTAMEARLKDAETRVAAREEALRALDASIGQRERDLIDRVAVAQQAVKDAERERDAIAQAANEVSIRESAFEKRTGAREQMLANGEAALAAWEKRLREQSERLERERAGHGQASQEAFALLAELERREQIVGSREEKLLVDEQALAARGSEQATADQELRVREARRMAELDLREDRLEERERDVEERERRLEERERDLTTYVSQLQGSLNERSVA